MSVLHRYASVCCLAVRIVDGSLRDSNSGHGVTGLLCGSAAMFNRSLENHWVARESTSREETTMKGPGLRIEIDVRRAWRCPTCGQNQRWPTDITAPRCFCVRDGVPMKLAEGQRAGRLDLRPELRSVLDRIQGGEEIPRLMSPISAESDSGAKSRGRPPRPDRDRDRSNELPRESRPQESSESVMPEPTPASPTLTTTAPATLAASTPQPPSPDEDDFGAGLSSPAEP